MSEPVTVILQTWARTNYALQTIAAARANLRYPDLRWYVADDGSRPEHYEAVFAALEGVNLVGAHSERRGYGGNANAAWMAANEVGALSMWVEDDWCLREPLDLYPYACLLMETAEVGMVRLGVLNLDIRGRTWAHGGQVYWKLDREPHLEGTPVFTGHPSLRHRRYLDAYGPYPEGLGPGDTELAYAWQFRQGAPDAPGIVWPADLPAGGVFGHVGAIKCESLL
jgi:hypothetical protein